MKKNWLAGTVLCAALGCAPAAVAQTQAAPAPAKDATAQTQTAPATGGARTSAPAAKPVAATTPVIKLPGLCAAKPAGAKCETVVTRAEFDRLVAALSGGRDAPEKLPPQVRRQIASSYSDLLLLAVAGENAKLEQSPEAKEEFRMARLRAFADLYRLQMQKRAQPAAEEVRKAYDENAAKYRQLSLERVVLPVQGGDKAKETELKQLAEQLQARAAKGEAFAALQAEAFAKAGINAPAETKVTVPAEALPPDQQALLQLKPGELTPVMSGMGAFYFFKLETQETIPFEKVREQIANSIAQKNLQREFDELRKKYPADLNQDFFGETPAAGAGQPTVKLPARAVPPAK